MPNKEIHTIRIKGYFIQAATELIRAEGLRSVSTRSVAEKAGYSYATLYNYFKDANELIFECVKVFQQECKAYVDDLTATIPQGKAMIKATALAYMDYFTEYPGIFELFFLERMGDIGNKKNISESIFCFFDILCKDAWLFCENQGLYDADEVIMLKAQLKLAVSGMLLFFMNRDQPSDYYDFKRMAHDHLDRILA